MSTTTSTPVAEVAPEVPTRRRGLRHLPNVVRGVGGNGNATVVFNGSNIGETFGTSNANHDVRLFRNIGNDDTITAVPGVEALVLLALAP